MRIQIINQVDKSRILVRGDATFNKDDQNNLYIEGATEAGEHYFHIFKSVVMVGLGSGYAESAMIELHAALPAPSGTGEGPKFFTIIIS